MSIRALWLSVFNATFNNVSVIYLLVEDARVLNCIDLSNVEYTT